MALATGKAASAEAQAGKSRGGSSKKADSGAETETRSGAQTLSRGLDVVDAVSQGTTALQDLATELGMPRSTAHRLASMLVERRYLRFIRGEGYSLGPHLLELGHVAGQQTSLQRVAREHLEALAGATGDTVHLGILEGSRALYIEKIPGQRRVEITSRVGERQPLRSTGIGKALILDADEDQLREYFNYEARSGRRYGMRLSAWLERMRDYAGKGFSFDLEENEDHVRCVAAPVRDFSGRIVAAISLSSAAQYMSDRRMLELARDVRRTAGEISSALGYREKKPAAAQRKPSPGKRSGAK